MGGIIISKYAFNYLSLSEKQEKAKLLCLDTNFPSSVTLALHLRYHLYLEPHGFFHSCDISSGLNELIDGKCHRSFMQKGAGFSLQAL